MAPKSRPSNQSVLYQLKTSLQLPDTVAIQSYSFQESKTEENLIHGYSFCSHHVPEPIYQTAGIVFRHFVLNSKVKV